MDDPDMGWEIQEYSPSKEAEITKVRWILNKGLGLGKKVVITGIAISSAPLVLPPLMVFSALGFAFSVPFGLVFASYACTNKLMSKLLPTPSILEYYTDEDEDEEKEGFERFVMEEEEEDQMEDIKTGVEMRIELDEEDDYWQKDVDYYEEQPTTYVDEYMEEDDYEEDVIGEYAKAEDAYAKEVDKDIEVRDENVEEEGYEEDAGEYVEGEDDYEKENEVREAGEGEKSAIKESKHEEPLAEMPRVVVVVRGKEDNNEHAREVKGLNLVVREVMKGDDGIEEQSVDNEIRVEFGNTDGYRGKDVDCYEPLANLDTNVEGEECKEHVGDYIEGEGDSKKGTEECIEVREMGDQKTLVGETSSDDEPSAEIRRVVILVPGNEDNNGNAREVEVIDLMANEVKEINGNEEETIDNGEEEIARGSTGLLEKIRNEGNIAYGPKGTHGVGEGGGGMNVGIIRPIEESFGEEERDVTVSVENEGAVEGTKSPLEEDVKPEKPNEKIGKEGIVPSKVEQVGGGMNVGIIRPIEESFGEEERDVTVSVENEGAVEGTKSPLEEDVKPEKPNEKIGKEGIVPSKVEQVGEADDTVLGNGKTIPDMNGTLNAKSFGGNVDTISNEQLEQEPVILKEVVTREERATDNTSTYASEDITLKKMRENIIHSDANIREIADESGFDLFDDRNVASHQNSYTAFQSLEAYDNLKDNTAEVTVDYLALPTSGRVSESNKETIPMQADKVPSSEVLLKEEKIWERIDAMRAIVGYKAAAQRTCIEELEALYIFTGVEPPASFKDPSDIADVNHKLRFLMSIVGVK